MTTMTGNYEFAASPDLVWETFLDETVLSCIMPGCEELKQTSESVFEGILNIRIGSVQSVFQGTVELSDLHPPKGCHILVNGRSSAGIVCGRGEIHLQTIPAGTELSYQGHVQVSGQIVSVGQRLMASSIKAIINQSLKNLEKQVQARLQLKIKLVE